MAHPRYPGGCIDLIAQLLTPPHPLMFQYAAGVLGAGGGGSAVDAAAAATSGAAAPALPGADLELEDYDAGGALPAAVAGSGGAAGESAAHAL